MSGRTSCGKSRQPDNSQIEYTRNVARAEDRESHRPPFRPWEVLLALLVLISIYAAMSSQLRLGPVWLLPLVVAGLLLALFLSHQYEQRRLARNFAIAVSIVGTLAVGASVVGLVSHLLREDILAPYLLRDAAMLWVANVIVFSLWYWELDGGGPYLRHSEEYRPTDLAFPQTTLGKRFSAAWTPQFADYLFVSFTASAAFSPTDTLFLSVRAKLLMMVQAMASIVIMVVVAARAINILH